MYTQGCSDSIQPWEILIYQPDIEQFLNFSISAANTSTTHMPYYSVSQLAKYRNNVLMMVYLEDGLHPIHTNNIRLKESLKIQYAVINSGVSVMFEPFVTRYMIELWPSDGVDLQYVIDAYPDLTIYSTYSVHMHGSTEKDDIFYNMTTLNPANDCICNQSCYKCIDCHTPFDISRYLSTEVYTASLRLEITSVDLLVIPNHPIIFFQRCNISIKPNDTDATYDDKSLTFSYQLTKKHGLLRLPMMHHHGNVLFATNTGASAQIVQRRNCSSPSVTMMIP